MNFKIINETVAAAAGCGIKRPTSARSATECKTPNTYICNSQILGGAHSTFFVAAAVGCGK